jgi:NTP pyrophosphatase (non-canonical NTP hydrolase)
MIKIADLIGHQGTIQTKFKKYVSQPSNIAQGWLPVHFAVSMLDAVIEEAIEVKRLIKARKWWTQGHLIDKNAVQLYTKSSPLRAELLSELVDLLIQFINVLYYLGITEEELEEALEEKLEYNDPDSLKSTIGKRS